MKEMLEAGLGVYIMLLMIVASLSCISSAIDAKNADATKTAYVTELENSNYSKTTMTHIFEDAIKKNYTVTLALYQNDGTTRTIVECTDAASLPADTMNVYMARIELKFNYTVALFNIMEPQAILGYAR